jgi:NADH:ubiquinone oxidoreductase subunit 2 (subunit N)
VDLAFPYADVSSFYDPTRLYVGLLLLSVIVSLVSATYYFKIYEYMSPGATMAETKSTSVSTSVFMLHDFGTLFCTLILMVVVSAWIVTVS